MNKRHLSHHFSLAGDFPRFMYSVDNIWNKYVEIELVKDLCTTKARIADNSFIFKDIPRQYYHVAISDVLYPPFFHCFFDLMKKLALCFEYISIEHMYNLLGVKRLFNTDVAKHLGYKAIDGLVDIRYGPAIIYIQSMIHAIYCMQDKDEAELTKGMMRRLIGITKERNRLHGYYVKRLNQLRKGESCSPRLRRSVIELDSDIPHIPINGLSLVLESVVREVKPGYIEKYPGKVIEVRGIGRGVSLVDLIQTNSRILKSCYRITENAWGPLYPSILIEEATEENVIVPDDLFLDG